MPESLLPAALATPVDSCQREAGTPVAVSVAVKGGRGAGDGQAEHLIVSNPSGRRILEHVDDQQTRLVRARLQGAVLHHARWTPLGPDEMAAAVTEVREVLAGRDDGPELLAYVAGILTGSRFGCPDELAQAVIAGSVCVAAGADEWLIDGWCCIGAERRAAADQLPGTARVL